MFLAISKPKARLPCLGKRVPGETDLRIFTTELGPVGRHRLDGRRPRLRVRRDLLSGRPVLVTGVAASVDIRDRIEAGGAAGWVSSSHLEPPRSGNGPSLPVGTPSSRRCGRATANASSCATSASASVSCAVPAGSPGTECEPAPAPAPRC
jgi:hypothetical protein